MHSRIINAVRYFVPIAALVLIAGDFALEWGVGDAATYTSVIRQAIYSYPGFGMFLAAAMGALWAHFFWTPGAEIETIKMELARRGISAMEIALACPGPHQRVKVIVHLEGTTLPHPGIPECSDWKPTEREAWLDVRERLLDRLNPLP